LRRLSVLFLRRRRGPGLFPTESRHHFTQPLAVFNCSIAA
jgi:hypothetical protein